MLTWPDTKEERAPIADRLIAEEWPVGSSLGWVADATPEADGVFGRRRARPEATTPSHDGRAGAAAARTYRPRPSLPCCKG
jgi:hypothetical protein